MMRTLSIVSLVATAMVCSVMAAPGASSSMIASGTFADKLVSYRDPDTGETWYEPIETGSGIFSATVPLGATDITLFDESTSLEVSIDGNSICSVVLGDDSNYSAGKRSATFSATDPNQLLKVAWTATTLTISGTAGYDIMGLGGTYDGTEGKITAEMELSIALGDFSISRPLFLKGTSGATHTTKGGEDYTLRTIKLSGSADFTPPTVSIATPAANYRTTNEADVTFTGTVSDNLGVGGVFYCVTSAPQLTGEEEFLEAEVTEDGKHWTAMVTPWLPGTNYVFVKAMDSSGNESSIVTRSFRYSVMSQIQVSIEGNGKVSGVTNGQWLEIGTRYTATAKPNAGQVLAYWQSIGEETSTGTGLTYSFLMSDGLELVATFVPNPYPAVKGTYVGLFYDQEQGVDPTNSGYFTLTVTTNGAYSGKLTMLSGTYSISGQLGLNPEDENEALANIKISRGKQSTLEGYLSFDLTDPSAVGGWYTVYNPGDESMAQGAFIGAPARASATKSEQGTYNLSLRDEAGNGGPVGFSYGTATLDAKAAVKLTLNLADPDQAAALSGSVALTTAGTVPFFFPAYGGKGLIMGWLQIDTGALGGDEILWLKPAGKTYYSDGFAANPTATGLLYVAPKAGTNLVDWTAGLIDLTDGADIMASAEISYAKGKFSVVGDNANKIALTVAAATGALSGSFTPTGTTKSVAFKGVLLKSSSVPGAAYGFFKSPAGSGAVLLDAQ